MKRLKFYIIKDEYIEYLLQYDKHIGYNKKESRPYIGIVLEINDITYFAPLFSPKKQHEKYKENPTFFKVLDIKDKSLGIIRFSDMIPVPSNVIHKLDIVSKDKLYVGLLKKQYEIINKNREVLYSKAEKLYDLVTVKKEKFYVDLCCDFKLLEEKSKKFNLKK